MHPYGHPRPVSGPRGGAGLPDGAGRAELDRAGRVAVDAVEAAGELLRAGTRDGAELGLRSKDASGDLVSTLDLAAERLIVDRIRAAFPRHQIVAEESGVLGREGTWTWLVDPLDGTNNLAIGLPAYVVGLALCRDRVPVLGVVHDPLANQTWSAVPGEGVHGPALRPHRPRHDGCRRPLLAWTQGHHVGRDDTTAWALKITLESTARRMLQLWTPLTSWLMLARGDIDGIVGYQAEAIDMPAGALIAVESGVVLRTLAGTPYDDRIGRPPADRSFVAARTADLPRLLRLVRGAESVVPSVKELWSAIPECEW
ncbi:MAG TPA: inositol monophosphatase family protein [Mycobacteriales bacterium]|nr:inositol monophosphatase family protein [Mycobacteriales bacterium]